MGLQSLGFYVVVTWLPQVFQDNGVSAATAEWLLFLFQAVAVLTSLAVPGALRWTRDQRAPATVCSAVLPLGYLGLLVAPELALPWSVVLGLGGGTCLVLALAFLGMRAEDAAGSGALSAMAQSVGYLLAAVGPVVFGLLHTVSSGWEAPLAVMCVAAAGQRSRWWPGVTRCGRPGPTSPAWSRRRRSGPRRPDADRPRAEGFKITLRDFLI
ncbi:hypothetical protein [Streptomyces purpureus]|uniref:MFS transporter n=1 Tax=Streptomyces purpureus TaxID=1951 RepID=A0A918LLP1_9ACTN|nr:hypothetical protein [Streptomyces purpureus]GGT12152.1 hypothetical protein GCM10014713_00700 [Streptomyces purpureus]